MNNAEIKNALYSKVGVVHNGIRYACISAVIYRVENGKLQISGEMRSISGNSVTVAPVERIKAVSE